ncbi:hypothetical protein C0991_004649 [Blastosporella zonata]|nr:hypothetical protein C0991_004649 [Blastosporella zonata]
MPHIIDPNSTIKRVNTREPPTKKAKASAGNNARAGTAKRHLAFTILEALPMDIIFEIFSHLHPLDILHLTRTTKDLRQLLLGRSGRLIWKAAFKNVPKLPQCPAEMTLPAWANLVFDLHCHECGKSHYKNVVDFILRIRLCGSCAKASLVSEKHLNKDLAQNKFILRCVPFTKWNNGDIKSCLVAAKAEFLKQLVNLKDTRQEFVNKSREDVKARIKHGEKCQVWLDEESSEKEAAVEEVRVARKNAIIERLREAGYSEEVDYMTSRDYSATMNSMFDHDLVPFARHPVVRVARPLTDQVWSNIKTKMIEHMVRVNIRMLRQRRLRLEESRKELALQAWQTIRQTFAPTLIVPSPVDILNLCSVRLLVDHSSDEEVTQDQFRVLLDKEITKSMVEDFRTTHVHELAKTLPGFWTPRGAAPDQKLALATSVFMCKRTFHYLSNDLETVQVYDDDPDLPLFYPEFLHHPCNSIRRCKGFYGAGDYPVWALDHNKRLGVGRQYRACTRDKWSGEDLVLHEKARGVVRKVLEACSLSGKTTVAQLDELDPRLICLKCTHGGKADGERICSVLSWRNAVKHCLKVHWGTPVSWQMILQEDAEKARALELLEPARRSLPPLKPKLWRCTICLDTPADRGRMHIDALTVHFGNIHQEHVEKLQEGPHYYKALEWAPPRPLTVKLVPQTVPGSESD